MDWAAFATRLGSLAADGSEGCGSELAYAAIEQLVGDEAIDSAVDYIVDAIPGRLLAQYVLVRIVSLRATERAYAIYQEADRYRAVRAVALIVQIHHPRSFAWIPQFLSDSDVSIADQGMDLLDAFLSATEFPDPEESEVEAILALAAQDPRPQIHGRVNSTRVLLQPEPVRQRDVDYLAEYRKALGLDDALDS